MSSSKFEDIDFDALREGALSQEEFPVDDVFGGESDVTGPIQSRANDKRDDQEVRYNFSPTWRSQLLNLIGFFTTSVGAVWVSRELANYVVIVGELFSTSSTQYVLHLPLLVLVPGFFLVKILIQMYDAKYIIDDAGIEAQIGRMSLNFSQPRIRWEDIRGVKPEQTIWERILDIGTVEIGSAMTQEAEIIMKGVNSPRAIQLLIEQERAKRHAEMKQMSGAVRQEYISRD